MTDFNIHNYVEVKSGYNPISTNQMREDHIVSIT